MKNYHNFRSITSCDEKHDNLQIYFSLKDQIMSNYFSLNHFKRHEIYVDNIRNNCFMNLCLRLGISESFLFFFWFPKSKCSG